MSPVMCCFQGFIEPSSLVDQFWHNKNIVCIREMEVLVA